MCLALLALFGLYVGSMCFNYTGGNYGSVSGPYTPVIKLNSPLSARPARKKDTYIITYLGGAVQRVFHLFQSVLLYFIRGQPIKYATLILMIFTDQGIVLFRQDFREADRIISLYTLQHGRINLRLPGVNRAKGKLKALSEPLSCGAYRIYARSAHVLGTVTGGKIEQVFPHIRCDINRQVLALHFCELFMRLTPLHQPSPEKYRLLLQALTELELSAPTPAFAPAFTLRLMAAAGFGLDHPVLQITPQFWKRMHEDAFSSLNFTEAEDLLSLSKCHEVCRRFLNQILTYPLQTLRPFTLPAEDMAPLSSQKHSSSQDTESKLAAASAS